MDKLTLNMSDISEGYGDWLLDSDTIDLEFNYDGGPVSFYNTPYDRDYLLLYAKSRKQIDEADENDPCMLWIENY